MDLFGEIDPPKPEPPTKAAIDMTEPPAPQEAFSHPRTMTFCLGHDAIEEKLLHAFNSGHMPHGLIFSGPKGIGKATLAYRLAKLILTQPNLINSGAHPDLMSVERLYDPAKNTYKASVEVSEIRKVTPFLRKTASYGGWRIIIIDDADTMNRSAQNALLKILEEPPEKTLLILVTHRLGTLIPTIRSRTQLINFQPLAPDTLQDLLARADHYVTDSDLQTLITLSGGSFGHAQNYIEEGALVMLSTIMEQFANYPHWDWPAIHGLADNMGRAGAAKNYKLFTELFEWAMKQLVQSKAKGQSITIPALDTVAFQNFLAQSSLEDLLKICDKLCEHFTKVERSNLDKRQGVLQAFSLIG